MIADFIEYIEHKISELKADYEISREIALLKEHDEDLHLSQCGTTQSYITIYEEVLKKYKETHGDEH